MLHTVEDVSALEKVQQVLVQLLLELQSEVSFRFVLDEIDKQLSDQHSLKGFQPTFNLLGTLVEAGRNVANILVTQYGSLLGSLCSALLYPDEGLKASVLYVWLKLFRGSTAQSLPVAIRDRLCVLLLQTLANAGSPQLIRSCVGLLWLLVQLAEAVSVLMNCTDSQIMCHENQSIHTDNSQILSQNQEQQSLDCCHLPLILKQLLLSGDEMLQVTSSKCIAAVLVHSPSQYSAPFIQADIPEFLFDRLASTTSEMLLWSVYSCLVLLTEDPLFFSQCHSVYGIESLVRSLKEAQRLSNLEVQKQGLLLLTEILERQPPSVRLFPSGPGFVAASEAVAAGVSSSCLLVATQGVSAASALFRLNHQARPVQYSEVGRLVEAITDRFSELSPLSSTQRRSSGIVRRSSLSSQASRSEGFLLQALVCFQAACRLAEQCASDPALKENAFTAPSRQGSSQDSLESLCRTLLHCCDSIWIPTVTRMYERAPNAQILQYFYSILSSQFTLLPPLMPDFANKLASTGFFRLALEHKGLLCAGNRNPDLNASCCGFLQKLSMCLLSQSDPASGSYQSDVEEVENLLLYNLPSVCRRLSDWPSLLCEAPGLQLSEHKGPRATQYCVVIMLHLALQQGDRLLPDQTVFSSVLWLLQSVQEQGSCFLPRSVLRSALYLLAVTQDKSPGLDRAPLSCISKALSSCQSFSSLYIHHPALLHFICRYPELAEKFGALVLELWLTKQTQEADARTSMAGEEGDAGERPEQKPDIETVEHLTLKYPTVVLTLLDMLCTREPPLAERALGVLQVLLGGRRDYEVDLCAKPRLLQALQRFSVEVQGHGLGQGHTTQAVNSLPLVLKLLSVMQASDSSSSSSYRKTDELHFKLLYHAVSMLLSNSGLMDQLQTVLSSSSAPSLSPSACPPSSLLCCSQLLLSSLITLQHVHSAQKHELLLRAAVNCLSSLLGFLQRKRDTSGKHAVCQPWTRFLLYCLLNSGDGCLLHPAILRLITLLLQHSSTSVLWEPDLLQVMEAAERTGVKELSREAAQALRLLLTQVQSSFLQPPPTEEHKQRVRNLMEALSVQTPAKSCSPSPPSHVLHAGDVLVCLSDFTLTTG
ncbi:unnamed protein product, partial [Pleuronectes platessa]